ncbi:uncharacterized protein PITG_22295, partial [Phytophthora infestans T30-4]
GTAELDTLKLELKGAQVCDTATLRKLVEAQAMINANIERTIARERGSFKIEKAANTSQLHKLHRLLSDLAHWGSSAGQAL